MKRTEKAKRKAPRAESRMERAGKRIEAAGRRFGAFLEEAIRGAGAAIRRAARKHYPAKDTKKKGETRK